LLSLKFDPEHPGFAFLQFIGNPSVVMLVSLIWATYSLGVLKGKSIKSIMDGYTLAVKDIALILLIIAGAGAFKEVLVESGISEEIGIMLQSWEMNPLLLGWIIAAIIRVSVGSATVAALTAAGIVAPLMAAGNVDPNLMVLSIGAGSLILSHVNDGGFWLVKEYFNLSIQQTLQSWTLLETVVAVLGLLGVLALDFIL
jgi:Gnt-I system high-affinity gluconate transporter